MAHRELYQRMNERWPKNAPAPSPAEAITGAKRLWRHAMGRSFKGQVKLTSGNRSTWIRDGILYVNPNEAPWCNGWREIVHGIAHLAHRRLNRRDASHSAKQAYIERDLVAYVLDHGFLDGKLKPKTEPKSKPDVVVTRYNRILAREKAWQSKLTRAQNAVDKVRRERREYERRHIGRILGAT